jgi:hypothetical protein
LAHELEVRAWFERVDDLAGQLTTFEDDVMASLAFEARAYHLFP